MDLVFILPLYAGPQVSNLLTQVLPPFCRCDRAVMRFDRKNVRCGRAILQSCASAIVWADGANVRFGGAIVRSVLHRNGLAFYVATSDVPSTAHLLCRQRTSLDALADKGLRALHEIGSLRRGHIFGHCRPRAVVRSLFVRTCERAIVRRCDREGERAMVRSALYRRIEERLRYLPNRGDPAVSFLAALDGYCRAEGCTAEWWGNYGLKDVSPPKPCKLKGGDTECRSRSVSEVVGATETHPKLMTG